MARGLGSLPSEVIAEQRSKTMRMFTIWNKWHCTPITVLLLGIISLGMLLMIGHFDDKQRIDFSFEDILADLQTTAASIHFQLEEWLSGDTPVDVKHIWHRFDRCISLINILLYGGAYEYHPHLPPLKDLHAQQEVEHLESLLISMKMTAGKWSEIPKNIGTDTALKKEYKKTFLAFQRKASELEKFIEKDQISNYATWKDLFLTLISSWICIIGISTVSLWRWEAKRRQSETALHRANSTLHAQAEELHKHREHLLELVEERTAELTQANNDLQKKILEHQAAEEALQESTNKFEKLSQEFHALLDAIPDFLVLLSPDLTIQWVNKNVALARGKSMTELTGQDCWRLWQSGKHGFAGCDDCPAIRTFRTGQAETARMSRPDGRIWDVRTFPVTDRHGHLRNVMEISRDVTEQVTMQCEAARIAHLTALGELAAGVAHEINNPINGIINYAQILVDDAQIMQVDADIAERIMKEGHRIATIVASLLSFAHEKTPEQTLVHLQAILADTLTLSGRQLEKDGIMLHVHLATRLPHILANYQEIEQVFLNIINNARYALNVKYPDTDAGKILEILGEHVTVDGSPHVQVTFHDHGVGIPASILHKVMDPFFSTKPRGHGTGLGLSLSHGIIVAHGGTLRIESVEREFTKVHVILPGRE
jgi:signal transduction histidine kinase